MTTQSSTLTFRNYLQCHLLVVEIVRWEENVPRFGFYLVNIKIDVAANTASATTTFRQIVEQLNVRLYQLKLGGVHHDIPHQYLLPSGSAPTPQLPIIYIWLCVIDCVYRRK